MKANYIATPNENGFIKIEINKTFFYLKTECKQLEIFTTIYEDDTNEALELIKEDGFGGWYAEPNENYTYYKGAMNGEIKINNEFIIKDKQRIFIRENIIVFERLED